MYFLDTHSSLRFSYLIILTIVTIELSRYEIQYNKTEGSYLPKLPSADVFPGRSQSGQIRFGSGGNDLSGRRVKNNLPSFRSERICSAFPAHDNSGRFFTFSGPG